MIVALPGLFSYIFFGVGVDSCFDVGGGVTLYYLYSYVCSYVCSICACLVLSVSSSS